MSTSASERDFPYEAIPTRADDREEDTVGGGDDVASMTKPPVAVSYQSDDNKNDATSSSSSSSSSLLSITLLPMNANTDSLSGPLKLTCSPEWTLRDLKSHALSDALAHGKRVVILFLGRRLLDDARTMRHYGVQSGHCLHVMVLDALDDAPADGAAAATSSSSSATGRHVRASATSASATTPATASASADEQQQALLAQAWEVDMTVGMDERELAEFERRYGRHDGAVTPRWWLGGASFRNRRRRDVIVYSLLDFLIGLSLGTFLGVFSIFWLAHDSTTLSQKFGIFCGLLLNIALNVSEIQMRQQQHRRAESDSTAADDLLAPFPPSSNHVVDATDDPSVGTTTPSTTSNKDSNGGGNTDDYLLNVLELFSRTNPTPAGHADPAHAPAAPHHTLHPQHPHPLPHTPVTPPSLAPRPSVVDPDVSAPSHRII